jgi:fatty-acyl-CoA synthase
MGNTMNLGHLLTQTAQRHGQEPGLFWRDAQWTWHDINQRVNAMVQALRNMGLRKGDRLLVQAKNSNQLFESAWIAFKLGVVWLPANFRLTPPEVAYLASANGASACLYDAGFEAHVDAARAQTPLLRHVVCIGAGRSGEHAYEDLVRANLGAPNFEQEVDAGDMAWFFCTSGTTGKPKAAVLTHGQMAFVVTNHLADLMPGLAHTDRSLVVAPLSHGAGIHALANTARGAASVLLPSDKLEAHEAWRLIEKHRVSNLFTVPTIVKVLTEDASVDGFDHSSLQHVVYAGAPMYRADQVHALRKLGKVLVQYYGLGEVTGNITVLPPHMHDVDDAHGHVGSCGYPRTGMQVAILDADDREVAQGQTGEICTRGPAVFAGYFNNLDATAKALKNGWFHTGDLGHVDARGLLYITGRASDMYISGGSNVYPREVEEALLQHPAIAEAAVLGMADAKWGESGVAVLVPRGTYPGELQAQDVLDFLEGKLSKYKWPRQVVFLPQLPKSAYGKVAKADLRQTLLAQGLLKIEAVVA